GSAGEADAGREVSGKVLRDDAARPADLVHDDGPMAVALLDAGGMHEDRERADEPDTVLDHQRDVLVAGQRTVLDGPHAFAHRALPPRAAVRGGRRIGAAAVGLLPRRADLVARVRAPGRHGTGRADSAGDEDLHVVGAAAEVLARAAPDVVHPVVA